MSKNKPRYISKRKNGKWITIDTKTGKVVSAGQGRIGSWFRKVANEIEWVGKGLVYSDKVDEFGRPLTQQQADKRVKNVDARTGPGIGKSKKQQTTAKDSTKAKPKPKPKIYKQQVQKEIWSIDGNPS